MKSGQRWQQWIGGEGTGSLCLEHPLTSVRAHGQVHAKGPRPGSASRLCLAGGLWTGHTHPQNSEGQKKKTHNETEVDFLCLRLGTWGPSIQTDPP